MTWAYDPKTQTAVIKHSEPYQAGGRDKAWSRAWAEIGMELRKNMHPGRRYEIAATYRDAEVHDAKGRIPGVMAIHLRCTLTGPLPAPSDDHEGNGSAVE